MNESLGPRGKSPRSESYRSPRQCAEGRGRRERWYGRIGRGEHVSHTNAWPRRVTPPAGPPLHGRASLSPAPNASSSAPVPPLPASPGASHRAITPVSTQFPTYTTPRIRTGRSSSSSRGASEFAEQHWCESAGIGLAAMSLDGEARLDFYLRALSVGRGVMDCGSGDGLVRSL